MINKWLTDLKNIRNLNQLNIPGLDNIISEMEEKFSHGERIKKFLDECEKEGI